MKKKTKKLLVIALASMTLLTGCTKQMYDSNKKAITNPETGQNLTANIICLPEGDELLNVYKENEEYMDISLDKLTTCSNMSIFESDTYDGLWVAFFVRPLAWIIIQTEKILGNYGLSVMLIGLIIRLILMPFSAKTVKQSQKMKEIQPELQKLEKKYAGKDDQDSMMRKSQETMLLYKKYNINPMSSCLISFIQLPLFLAFLEAINRVPAIFESNLWKFQLGTTPLHGIQTGNYWYIILILLIVLFTALTFVLSMGSMKTGNPAQEKQQKYMMLFMIAFIGIASLQLSSAIGLYWIVTNAFGVVQTLVLNNQKKNLENDQNTKKYGYDKKNVISSNKGVNEVKEAEFTEKKSKSKSKKSK